MLLLRIAVFAGKAEIDVPAGVAGVVRMREAHRKGSKAVTRQPTAFAGELIEGGVENGSVRRLSKWPASIPRQPDDRPCPCRRLVRIAREVPPHDGAAVLRQ